MSSRFSMSDIPLHLRTSLIKSVAAIGLDEQAQLIFVTTVGDVRFREFCPILANFGYLAANLRTFWCTFAGLKMWWCLKIDKYEVFEQVYSRDGRNGSERLYKSVAYQVFSFEIIHSSELALLKILQ